MAEAPQPPARRRRSRHRSAVDRVQRADFPVTLRGYERQAVDKYVSEVVQIVTELEATQLREAVVQRALDEVGEQTSGILQHAHQTAEEISARSRAQAEGRLQRAEKEADEARREADAYAEQVVADASRLWQERQRLVEDMRQLADEMLGVADDALDRLEQPQTGAVGAAPAGESGDDAGHVAVDSTAEELSPTVEDEEELPEEAGDEPPPAEAEEGEQDPDTTAVWPSTEASSTTEFPAPAAPEQQRD